MTLSKGGEGREGRVGLGREGRCRGFYEEIKGDNIYLTFRKFGQIFLDIPTNIPIDQQNRQADIVVHRKVTLPKILNYHNLYVIEGLAGTSDSKDIDPQKSRAFGPL